MISITQDAIYLALWNFITSLIPGPQVIQGLGNGVPMPAGPFICMTATFQARLSTNIKTVAADLTVSTMQPTRYDIQIDCYGPESSDWATTISTMLRDSYGCDALAPTCQPLYTNDPQQMPLITAEENYLQRWLVSAVLQFNPVTTLPQQSAIVLDVELVEIDATYPP